MNTGHRTIVALLTVIAVASVAATTIGRPMPAASQDGVEVFFSPKGGCTEVIIDEIENAKLSVLVQAYSFTSAPIAKALLAAHKRGVYVEVVLDSSQRTAKYSSATFFRNQGIPVHIDSDHAIAHNKVILIDDRTIITGSFNFSKAAEERNAENLLVIKGKPALMKAYRRNLAQHLNHSERYGGLDRDPLPKEPQQPAAAVTAKQRAAMKTVRESVVRVLGGGVTFDSEQAAPSPGNDDTYYVAGTAITDGVRKRYKATVYYYDGAFVLGVLSRPDGTTLR